MGKKKYVIRLAEPDEFNSIAEFLVRVFSAQKGFPKPDRHPEYYQKLRRVGELARNPGVELLAAITDDKDILGAVLMFTQMRDYGLGANMHFQPGTSGFRFLSVAPQVRGYGVGTLLVAACIQRARDGDMSQMIIHTPQKLQSSWQMYSGLGFTRAPELDFMQENFPVYGLRKWLRPC